MLIVNSNVIVFPCIATMPRFLLFFFFSNHLVLESFEMNKKIISWELKDFFLFPGEFFWSIWSVGCIAGLDFRSSSSEDANFSGLATRKATRTATRHSLISGTWKMFESKSAWLMFNENWTELNWLDPIRRRREVDRFLQGRTKKWTQRVCSTLYSIVLVPW